MANDFTVELQDILNHFNTELQNVVYEAAVAEGKAAAKELQNISPQRTKQYSKGWTIKEFRTERKVLIYNKQKPQLAHLLENRHKIVAHGKAYGFYPGKEHIAPVEKMLTDKVEKIAKEAIERAAEKC